MISTLLTKVYVAGASAEIERVRPMVKLLRDSGVTVVSSWIENIDRVGKSNPTDASRADYMTWVFRNLAEVEDADILWLLIPSPGVHTIGAWVELGYACNGDKAIIMSGQHRPIHTPALAQSHFAIDEAAAKFLIDQHRGATSHVINGLLESVEG